MLKVKKLHVDKNRNLSLKEVEDLFNSETITYPVDKINWADYPYKPEVKFKIAHSDNAIYLQFFVTENCIRAIHTHDNDNVWTDSCVEFFFSPANDGSYYNLEANCIGTALLGFGHGKIGRERAGIEITSKILRSSSVGNKTIELREGNISWNMILIIPAEVFHKHNIKSFSGLKAKANFYKCGDELTNPHYVSWNPIVWEKPNFHLPEFFGEIEFE